MLRKVFVLSVFLLLFGEAKAQEVPTGAIFLMDDLTLIENLASKNLETAENAAREVFRRGTKIIPLLVRQEGNRSCFYGLRALGDWSSGGTTRSVPSCDSDATFVERN
jgi:hypothetical protein